MSLFGSAAREDFDPARSDVDLLVEYEKGRHPGLDLILGYDGIDADILWDVLNFRAKELIGELDRILDNRLTKNAPSMGMAMRRSPMRSSRKRKSPRILAFAQDWQARLFSRGG